LGSAPDALAAFRFIKGANFASEFRCSNVIGMRDGERKHIQIDLS